jgi:hypothetical protein
VKPKTRHAIVVRSERSIRELHLSSWTQADKTRLFQVERALHALDDEQAALKYEVEKLVKKYEKKKDIEALLAGLKKLIVPVNPPDAKKTK